MAFSAGMSRWRSPSGTQHPSPLQRTWMSRLRIGSIARMASMVRARSVHPAAGKVQVTGAEVQGTHGEAG